MDFKRAAFWSFASYSTFALHATAGYVPNLQNWDIFDLSIFCFINTSRDDFLS